MDKEAFNPFNAYHKYVGSKPLIDMPLSAGAGTMLGYYGAPLVLDPIVAALAGMTGATPDKVERVRKAIKRYGGLAGFGLGSLYGLGKHMDTGGGLKGAFRSLVEGQDYWENDPDARNRYNKKIVDTYLSGKKSIRTPNVLKSLIPEPFQEVVPDRREIELEELRRQEMQRQQRQQQMQQVRESLQKQQSYNDPGTIIPLDYAMSVIQADPFLSLGKKSITTGILQAGSEDDETVDGPGIMQGALRFGAGSVPAYLLGKNLSQLLGMEPKNLYRLSGIGGVAAGIMNTGIFGGSD